MPGLLGVYFGPKVISIVEAKGNKIINHLKIAQSAISSDDLEENVPSEVKAAALFKDEFRRNKIEARKAVLSLSGRDLIVRMFEMPDMPLVQLRNNINQEAQKYLSFKIDELVSDFQIEHNKATKRNLVLFMGIKKETLDKYLGLLSELNIQPVSIEYSGFSILKFVKLSRISDKGIIAVANVDFEEADEVNFTVLENGFPLFSRDINSPDGLPEQAVDTANDPALLLEKLKAEMRISLDYYHRKFPNKEINKIHFISDAAMRSSLDSLAGGIGVSASFVNTASLMKKPIVFSSGFLKAYSACLFKLIKTKAKINLLSPKLKPDINIDAISGVTSLFSGIKIDPRVLVPGLFICIMAFAYANLQVSTLQGEVSRLMSARNRPSTVNKNISYEELSALESKYNSKLESLDTLINKRFFLTTALKIIPRVIPRGVRLESLSMDKTGTDYAEIALEGMAYLADSDKETEAINTFLANLKSSPEFAKYFKEINIVSLDKKKYDKLAVTSFSISCKKL